MTTSYYLYKGRNKRNRQFNILYREPRVPISGYYALLELGVFNCNNLHH